jgi:hypothetical protein
MITNRRTAGSGHVSETLTLEQAAEVLGVDADRVRAMIDEDLLHPLDGTDDTDGPRFDPAEVDALHNLGG